MVPKMPQLVQPENSLRLTICRQKYMPVIIFTRICPNIKMQIKLAQASRTATATPSSSSDSSTFTPLVLPTQQFPGLLPLTSYTATVQFLLFAQKLIDAQTPMQSSRLYTKASESFFAALVELLSNGELTLQYRVKFKVAPPETTLL